MPARLPRYINPDAFVRENFDWLLDKLRETGRRPAWDARGETALVPGGNIQFLGQPHRLVCERLCVSTPHVHWNREARAISVYLPQSPEYGLASVLKTWLRQFAKQRILHVVEEEAEVLKVAYNRVSVREQKTKWGSCTEEGNLSFNWRLILFPPRVLRYVVVHELCHLRHFDHSVKFWRMVARRLPDYRSSVDWLQNEGMNARNLLVELT
jgi:predicted metal-dependent hydrolase